jgi:AcrR family transcriptional regulator
MTKRAWGGLVQGREELHRLKRQVVLEVAAKTIRRQGYSQTTLTDIADALHVSKPALYYYFKSKDQIMFEIQHLAIDMLMNPDPSDPESPFSPDLAVADRLGRFVRRYVRMITSDYGACLILTSRQALEADSRRRLVGALRPINQLMEDIVRDGIREGSFVPADVALTTAFVFGSLNWIPVWHHAEGDKAIRELAEVVVTHITRALGAGAAGLSPAPAS